MRRDGNFPRVAARAAGGAALALCAATARADERDDRIRDLERMVRDQAAEQARLRSEVEAMKSDRAGAVEHGALRAAIEQLVREEPGILGTRPGDAGGASHGDSRFEFGGYFSTRYANSELPGKKPSFQDMRLVPKFHAEVSRAVRFDAEIELEHGGVSEETEGEVKIEYAEARLGESECLTFKVGSLLAPWGRFNQEHDDPLNDLSSRPTVARLVGGTVLTAPGIGIEGVLPASDDLAINYDVVLVNGIADDVTAGDGIREARTLWEDDENHDKTVFGRVGATPTVGFADALDLGASFTWGRLGERADDVMRGFALDAAAKWGAWEVKGEWMKLGIDREGPAAGEVRGLGGWYGQALYRIHDPWVRALPFAEESASVALVLRRDAVDTDDRNRGAAPADDERAWTFGVNYRPTPKTVIKFEYRRAESGFAGREGEDRDLIVFEFATFF